MMLMTLPLLAAGLLAGCSAGHTAPAVAAPTAQGACRAGDRHRHHHACPGAAQRARRSRPMH